MVWSAGKARLDKNKRQNYLKRLLDELDHISRQLNKGRYAARDYVIERIGSMRRGNSVKNLVWFDLQGTGGQLRLKFHIDRDKLTAVQALDGQYALATNAEYLSANEALTLFKRQDDAEKQFQVVKGPLAVLPVFLHSDQRIKGLVFVTLVALLDRALLVVQCQQAGLSISANRLLAEFAYCSVIELTLTDGSHVRHVTVPMAFPSDVSFVLGVPPCERYLTA